MEKILKLYDYEIKNEEDIYMLMYYMQNKYGKISNIITILNRHIKNKCNDLEEFNNFFDENKFKDIKYVNFESKSKKIDFTLDILKQKLVISSHELFNALDNVKFFAYNNDIVKYDEDKNIFLMLDNNDNDNEWIKNDDLLDEYNKSKKGFESIEPHINK